MATLVTGTDGYVGRRLVSRGEVVPLGRAAGDVCQLGERIERVRPSAVVHLAAMSSIAACEADPEEARRVNVEGTRIVARATRGVGARLVFVSTDQVFDGLEPPYAESARPSPVSHYGATKADAEDVALEEGGERTLVVRLHLVVGTSDVAKRPSGTDLVLDALRRDERPHLFTDEFRSPIHIRDVADALLELAVGDATGVLHLGGPERLSRYEIGRMAAEATGLDPDRIRAGSIREHAGLPRTPDTSFDTTRAREILRGPPRPIAEAFRDGASGPTG